MNNYCEFSTYSKKINKIDKKIIEKQLFDYNTEVTRINISSSKIAKKLNKDIGIYTNIFCKEDDFLTNIHFDFLSNLLIDEISKFLKIFNLKIKDRPKIFVVGLGNSNITADRLGSLVVNKVISTSFELENNNISGKYFADIFSLSPSVASYNGIYTSKIVKALCSELKPDLVVLVDSLSCKNIEILGKTFQLSSSGLTPGSEIGLKQPKINKKLLNTPVLTIGCPLVCRLKDINKHVNVDRILTLKDIDIVVKKCANIIAYSINKCFHSLSKEEILFLSKE